MKKLIVLVFTVLLSAISMAQGLDFGVKAGANFSNFSGASNVSNKTGFLGGIFAGAKLGDKIGIQADLLYSQQGAEFDAGKIDLNYVNVPVVLKYYLFQGFNLQAGPQFGFVVDDNVFQVFNNVAEAESFDLSGVLGVGYDLALGLRLDGRFNFGLSDIFSERKGKNSVFSLALGYSFL